MSNASRRDARGEPVTIHHSATSDRFELALRQFHSYRGDPLATLDTALAEDPGFALGHLFRAECLLLTTEAGFVPEARASFARAQALEPRMNARERGHLLAVRRWLDGDWDGACRAWDRVLVEHPRDALALQAAHLGDFYRGDARSLRDRVERVLPHWNESIPGYSYVLGMLAFGLEECNQYAESEHAGRAALELEPVDAWAVHAVAHVMEMQGRPEDGARWLESRAGHWSPENGLAYHNWWHRALFHLELGEYRDALALYDSRVFTPENVLVLQHLDATAMLWRLRLLGVNAGERWQALAARWAAKIDVEAGFYAFNDLHALIAFVGAGRSSDAACVLAALERAARGGGSNAAMSAAVGLPAARAILDFDAGRHAAAAEALLEVRPLAYRFGGSHAQRDLLTQTLIAAAIAAGDTRLAAHVLNERRIAKPHTALTRLWSERIATAGMRAAA